MNTKDMFEYGGFWLHSSEQYSLEWRKKSRFLIPPIEAYHLQLIILKHLGREEQLGDEY